MRGPLPLALALVLCAGPSLAQDEDALKAQVQAIRASMRGVAAAKPAASAPWTADTSSQFPPEAYNRDQANINDCHDFVAVAVLEAAYFRATGLHRALSQADLFIQNTMLAKDVPLRAGAVQDTLWASHPLTSEYIAGQGSVRGPSETDMLTLDFRFAIAHGVASADALPYAAFRKDYEERQRPALVKDIEASEAAVNDGIRRGDADYSRFQMVNGTKMNAADIEREAEVQTRIGPRMRRRAQEFLTRMDPDARGKVDVSRANIHEVTKGFSVDALDDAPDCKADPAGRRQQEFLMAQLGAGRPVGISLDIAGLPGWGHENEDGFDGHGIVITGLRYDRGRPMLTTLNSWGPQNNLPLPADQACRIAALAAIRIPGER